MAFFYLFRRRHKKQKEILELDKEISTLQSTKTQIAIDIEKSNCILNELQKKVAKSQEIITLDEKIKIAKDTLADLETDVEAETATLEKLKQRVALFSDCISLQKLNESLNQEVETQKCTLDNLKQDIALLSESISLQEFNEKVKQDLKKSLNDTILSLFTTFPNLTTQTLHLAEKFYSTYIVVSEIMIVIDRELTSFALDHQIDPILYKEIMYSFNSSWMDYYNKISYYKITRNSDDYQILLNGFVVLTDKKS